MPRAAAILFPKPANLQARAQLQVIAVLQDIEAAWRRLAKRQQARDSLFSIYQQQALPLQHQLSERKAELIAALLQYANNPQLTAPERLALMDWLDELLEELEYHHFNSPQLDLAALGQQFMECFDDQWLPFDVAEPDMDFSTELPEAFASLAASSADEDWSDEVTEEDDEQWPPVKLQAAQVHLALAQKLTSLLPGIAAAGDGTEQQVKELLLTCYQQLLQDKLPLECLAILVKLLASYRYEIEMISMQLALGDTPAGWVLMTFGSCTKAELPPALAGHIADLRHEMKVLSNELKQCKSVKALKLLLDEREMLTDDSDLEFNWFESEPDNYH